MLLPARARGLELGCSAGEILKQFFFRRLDAKENVSDLLALFLAQIQLRLHLASRRLEPRCRVPLR